MQEDKTENWIKRIVPPVLLNFYRKHRRRKHRRNNEFDHRVSLLTTPNWHTIMSGPLKGRSFFIANASDGWRERIRCGVYDSEIIDIIKLLSPSQKVIYDIGAHIGYHTLCFAQMVGDKGQVYAFEPSKDHVDRIKKQFEKNRDLERICKLFTVALGSFNGETDFSTCKQIEDGLSSMSHINVDSLYANVDSLSSEANEEFVKRVPIFTLDDFFKANKLRKPDIIKIDVEGAENEVLLGSAEVIGEYRPKLLIEVHAIPVALDTSSTLFSYSYRYEIIKKEKDGRCIIYCYYKE